MGRKDRGSVGQGAHSGQNRVMTVLGIAIIVVLVLAVLVLATGLGEMTPWDGGEASDTTQ